jgi:chromate reductase, NAD(P)H dehydrogenase (quinone)
MITIISGTNRKDSTTLKLASYYYKLMAEKSVSVSLLSLEEFNAGERNERFIKMEQELLIPAEKFVFIMPEYNGSFPGILKLLLDNSNIGPCWWYKKAALIGLAEGRGGNLRGMEHMTNILHYLKMNVHYQKLAFSKIRDHFDSSGNLDHTPTHLALTQQIGEFIKY